MHARAQVPRQFGYAASFVALGSNMGQPLDLLCDKRVRHYRDAQARIRFHPRTDVQRIDTDAQMLVTTDVQEIIDAFIAGLETRIKLVLRVRDDEAVRFPLMCVLRINILSGTSTANMTDLARFTVVIHEGSPDRLFRQIASSRSTHLYSKVPDMFLEDEFGGDFSNAVVVLDPDQQQPAWGTPELDGHENRVILMRP